MRKYLSKLNARIIMMCIIAAISFMITGCNEKDLAFLVLSTDNVNITPTTLKHTVEVKTNGRWNATSDAQWCHIVNGSGNLKGTFEIVADANRAIGPRTATVTVSTQESSATISVRQAAADISTILAESVTVTGLGETIKVPVAANLTVSVRSSAPWCNVSVESNDGISNIVVIAEKNNSDEQRTAVVTVDIEDANGGPKVSKKFDVIQLPIDMSFTFADPEITLLYEGQTRKIAITANSDWEIELTNIPRWATVDPISGTGNSTITVTGERNLFIKERSFDLIAVTTDSPIKKTTKIVITQQKNPTSAIPDYKYLGKGYDTEGEFANDTWVKAAVLDWELLDEKNYIADIILASASVEYQTYGKTLDEYQKDYAHKGGVSGNYGGFSASVNASYSNSSKSSSENSYASKRHVTQRQIVKLYEHLTADNLKECMTPTAKAEINGELSPKEVIMKYGTYVIAGFVLGGSLEYSMTAVANESMDETSWGIAVEAGYKAASAGIKATYEYNQYESFKSSSANFEEKLLARGGDSQYASVLGSQETFNSWLGSLSDPNKWVMVDYAGNKLIPIWEFATDITRSNQLKDAVIQHKTDNSIGQTSAVKKRFSLRLNKVALNDSDDGTHQIRYSLSSIINNNPETQVKQLNYEGSGVGNSWTGYWISLPEANVNETRFELHTPLDLSTDDRFTEGSIFNLIKIGTPLSFLGNHTVGILIEVREHDTSSSNSNDAYWGTTNFTYKAGSDRWQIGGQGDSYKDGDSFWIRLYPGGGTSGGCVIFNVTLFWKEV